MKQRLDQALTARGIVISRSQAESWVRLGKVVVNGKVISKPGHFVNDDDELVLKSSERYVSRAGLKLSSTAKLLGLDFTDKIVLDVGSSTGGFTDYALQNGAKKVYAIDVGTDQLHQSLHGDKRIELHEKTDIRDYVPPVHPDIVVIDVSFISLRQILPHIADISGPNTQIVSMVKPQFEAGKSQVNKGVIKNDRVRRDIMQDFEMWAKQYFIIVNKADSDTAGAHGNKERFYLLKKIKQTGVSS